MRPSASARNFTPTSTALLSLSDATAGVVPLGQMVQGQVWLPVPTVTATPALGDSRLPLSSVARLRSVKLPELPAAQVYVHVPRPVARCQVVPPSVETSTPPTTPPPVSVAVPDTVTCVPGAIELLAAGEVIVDLGAVASELGVAAVRPVMSVPGWAPMSANRLTVACCMLVLAAALPRSWLASSPHDHWTVPAPKTRAPLAALYIVMLCTAVPAA